VHPALESLCGKAARDRAHFVRNLRPAPGLPDAQILFARGGMIAAHLRVVQEKARERVQ
jgi:hypothetical protein